MKLSYEDKVRMYRSWKRGEKSPGQLARENGLNHRTVEYMVRLMNLHGEEIARHGKNRYYSPKFKEKAIKRVLIGNEAVWAVSIHLGLPHQGTLSAWIKSYKENGYTVIERKRGRHGKKETEDNRRIRSRTESLEGRELEAYHRERILKKIRCLGYGKREVRKEEIAVVITELRQELKCSLRFILEMIKENPELPQISRSDYYYVITKEDKDTKNDEVMNRIIDIYYRHKGRYGYRRIHLQLLREGIRTNHKKVQRLMRRMGLLGIRRNKRRYSSYQGTIGKVADNIIERDFFADKPNQKWYTDITEFNLRGEKVYLSPILDGYAGDIVSYNISRRPDYDQIRDMLDKAFKDNPDTHEIIFHSDQGWQYQYHNYQKTLLEHYITQSMSRKGNSLDNGLMENFFGLLKTEMFYEQEESYNDIDELIKAIEEYINYYNNERIKTRLKGLTPMEYRSQALINY